MLPHLLGYFGHIAHRQPNNLDRLIMIGKVEKMSSR